MLNAVSRRRGVTVCYVAMSRVQMSRVQMPSVAVSNVEMASVPVSVRAARVSMTPETTQRHGS